MYAVIAFALISVASAIPGLNSYYGAGALGYASPYAQVQKVIAPQVYGAQVQKVFSAPSVYGAAIQKVYSPNVYASRLHHDANVERDYTIEALQGGERYAIQNGPVHFEYNNVRGDLGHRGVVAQKIVSPYGVPSVYGAHIGVPSVYGAHLRAGPIVQKDVVIQKQYVK